MKIKTQYSCQSCGHISPKWLGRCPSCEAWNSLVEEDTSLANAPSHQAPAPLQRAGAEPWVKLSDEDSDSEPIKRLSTGISELDRVLGGGMVPDSFTLLGGDPGIGKSTLLLQMVQGLLKTHSDLKILYVSGEESVDQIRTRAKRIGVSSTERVFLSAETQFEKIVSTLQEIKPQVLLMDSLQTFSSGLLASAPGSVGQVRDITARLMQIAKTGGVAVWLVGHVTKEGSIAGPKTIEHMVDTVLYFEGEGGQTYRLLRTVKNRFGSTRELGVFEMEGEGLREVTNPSSLFLSERKQAAPGIAIAASLEGSRPILVELQALVAPSGLAMPRRTSVGMDSNRVSLLAAILERHMRLQLAQNDLFFNVAGGLKLSEPACDLAAAASIWSSAQDIAIPENWVLMGELGLTGEVRRVPQLETRLLEAKKLGFKVAIVPESSPKNILEKNFGIKILTLDRIQGLTQLLQSL